MSKTQSMLMLLVLGSTLAACGSDPADPAKTTAPGDKLSAILSTPGPATTCLSADEFPPPPITPQNDPNATCPDSGSACGNTLPYRWCKLDSKSAIVMCEKAVWVVKATECP